MTNWLRRAPEPPPWTWEPRAVLIVLVLFAIVCVWASADLVVDAATGVPIGSPFDLTRLADVLTSTARLVIAFLATLVVVVGGVAATRTHLWTRLTGRARTGFATAAQAQRTLGRPRLEQAAEQIRPDLYGKANR